MPVMDDSEREPVDPGAYDDDLEEEGALILVRQVPLGVVFARIVVVSGMGITGALASFFLIAARLSRAATFSPSSGSAS